MIKPAAVSSFSLLSRTLLAGVVTAMLVAGATTAWAGFQIKGAGIPQPPPMSGGALESSSTLAPIGMMPDAAGRPTIPVTAVPIDAPVPRDQSAANAAAANSGVIDGFGYDLPLVIALQQVAPAGYQFSFSDAVDPGQRVSWQGGKPWRDVVTAMLSPLGLGYAVRDGSVLMIAPTSEMPALQTAQVTPPQAGSGAPQQLRRQKPSSLLDRVKSKVTGESEYHDPFPQPDVMGEPLPAPLPPASTLQADERMVEPVPMPQNVPAAEVLSMQDDLSPIELTARRIPLASTSAVTSDSWQAAEGATLRDILGSWSARANVDLHWSIDYDYRLPRAVTINGNYADAVSQILDLFRKVKPRPYAQLHRPPGQPQVLVIKAYGVGN